MINTLIDCVTSQPDRLILNARVEDQAPRNQGAWLEGLVYKHGYDLDRATITVVPQNGSGTTWRISVLPPHDQAFVASFTYRSERSASTENARSAQAQPHDTSIKTSLHKTFGSTDYAPLDIEAVAGTQDQFRAQIPVSSRFVGERVLSVAADFHITTSRIVRAHGGIDVRAELRYGPLVLENLLYPSQR